MITADLVILPLAALAAFFMLMRGDPRWTHPVIAAVVALIVVPLAAQLMLNWFGVPASATPSASLQSRLAENYERIHTAFEIIKTLHGSAALAVYSLAWKDLLISMLLAFAPGGQVVAVAKWAMGLFKFDPIYNIALTVYNALTSLGMVYHVLEFFAGVAKDWALPLLMLSIPALAFGPTRGLGGFTYAFALLSIVLSHVGAFLTPAVGNFTLWAGELVKWGEAAAREVAGSSPPPLLAVEGAAHTLYLARYNNSFVYPSADYAAEGIWWVLNASMPGDATEDARRYITQLQDVVREAARGVVQLSKDKRPKPIFNGTDWVAASVSSVTPVAYGEKNWTAYAVNTWLDFPAPTPVEGSCVQRGNFSDILDVVVEAARRANNAVMMEMRESLEEMSRRVCNFTASLGYRSYHVRVETPAHWRFLTVAINYTAVDKRRVLERGLVYAHNGVWGWLQPPDEERCFDALGREAGCGLLDTTLRRGLYNFSLWTGEKKAVDPVVGEVRSEFNVTLEKAPDPVFSWSEPLHRWVETCEWCCGWACDGFICWCTRWCSSSRDVFERERVSKVLGSGQYQYAAAVYNRPWVPEDPANYTGRVPLVTRRWEVEKWVEYGPWVGDGVPPPGAYCYEHSRRVYKVLQFFQTQPAAPRVVYGFYWLRAGEMQYAPHGDPLPDVIGQYTDADGVEVVEYLEGVEHQYYCRHEFPPASTPNWQAVPGAERNLTTLLKDDYFNQMILRNFTKAVFKDYGFDKIPPPNDAVMKAVIQSGYDFLKALEEPPKAAPLYHTEPRNYDSRNVLFICVMYDWRNETKTQAALYLTPGREWWAAYYPMGDSRVARQYRNLTLYFKYMLNNPPPPPPAALSNFFNGWEVPWNNRTLPYTPYYHPRMKMPPVDEAVGAAVWDVSNAVSAVRVVGEVVGNIIARLFVSVFAALALFELLAVLFEFPSPLYALWHITTGIIQEWTYWLPIRLFIRAKLPVRIWRAVKAPVMRRAVRTAARAHSWLAARVPALRRIRHPDLKEYYREYVKRKRDLVIKDPAEAERERIKKVFVEDALERIRRAVEEREDVKWFEDLLRRREEERRRLVELARRLYRTAAAHDVIQAVREMSPKIDAGLQRRAEAARRSLAYHLFWWRLDRLSPLERLFLRVNPAVVERQLAEGRITQEEAQALLNLRAYVEARRRELTYSLSRLHEVSQYVKLAEEEWEAARRQIVETAERGLAHLRRAVQEFARHHERLGDEAVVKAVAERLKAAVEQFAKIDNAARPRLISALNEALQRVAEGRAPQIPRDASVEDVVRHLASLSYDTALKALRGAYQLLEGHYAVAPWFNPRATVLDVVNWKIAEELPTLKIAGLARGIALGARGVEEGETALKTWSAKPAGRYQLASAGGRTVVIDVYREAPWEAVAGRASLLRELRLDVREAVRIKPDVVLTADYAEYLAGFRVEKEALKTLKKAVEYGRITRQLERAEELRLTPKAVEELREGHWR